MAYEPSSIKITFYWERLDSTTQRAKVYGGWLVRSKDTDECNGEFTVESMVFVSDPLHKWET